MQLCEDEKVALWGTKINLRRACKVVDRSDTNVTRAASLLRRVLHCQPMTNNVITHAIDLTPPSTTSI